MPRSRFLFSTVTSALVVAAPASAVLLAPGGNVDLAGTTAALNPELAGLVLVDEVTTLDLVNVGDPDDPTAFYSNQQQTRVVRSTLDGTLRFAYRLINQDTFTMPTKRLEVSGFAGYDADVDWRIDGLGDGAPLSARRSDDGDTIVFDFGDYLPIAPDDFGAENSSVFFYVNTNAVDFDRGGSTLFVGGLTFPTLGATGGTPRPVPEPASAALLAAGGLLMLRRRRTT